MYLECELLIYVSFVFGRAAVRSGFSSSRTPPEVAYNPFNYNDL